MKNTYFSHYLRDPSDPKHFCLPIFNRATYGRCKTLITEIARHPEMKITVVLSSGSLWEEFGNASEYIEKGHKNVEFHKIEIPKTDGSHLGMALSASMLTQAISVFLNRNNFNAVIAVADRYETLPVALAASYMNIPLIHIQGGELTGNIDDKVRHAVTKLADYHFVSTKLSKEYVIEMGEDRSRVFNTGCPSLDLIQKNGIYKFRAKEKYILSIFHPETENPTLAFEQTQAVLNSVWEYCIQYGYRCYWFYPNPDPGREEIIEYLDHVLKTDRSPFIKAINKEPEKFLWQLAGARLIIGNSSCGIREASFLGVPAINVGDRQGLRERAANVIDATYNEENIKSALHFQHEREMYLRSYLYGTGRSAEYIVRRLEKLDLSSKGSLTYPFESPYKEKHFGEKRFHDHEKRLRRSGKKKSEGAEEEGGEGGEEKQLLHS